MPVMLLVLAFLFGVPRERESACRIYVEPISVYTGSGAQPIRDRVVERIEASGKCTVVTRVELAGAVLSGSGWISPLEIDASPEGTARAGHSVLEVELKSPTGKPLWKERITPRWFSPKASRSLADEAVRQLLAAQGKWSLR